MRPVALRTALIWNDEVMGDVVSTKPTKITVGATKKSTFVIPDLGLPATFAIVRPGRRGYLLTLGENMRGTVCIEGVQRDVHELVTRGADGGFHATPISGRDWGVIELDETGVYKLFFQFVPVDEPHHFFTPKVVVGGVLGYLISTALLTVFFLWRGEALEESAVRGAAINLAALILGGIVWKITKADSDSQTSLAFSTLLHAALLVATYQLADLTNPHVWPGRRDFTGDYLLTRIPKVTEEPQKTVTQTGPVSKEAGESAQKAPVKKAVKTATVGAEGAAGGKGETERARDPNAPDLPPPPKEALLTDANTREIENIVQRSTETALANFARIKGDKRAGGTGFGTGTGTGVGSDANGTGTTRGGKGKGPGGGGKSEGDHVSNKNDLDMGKERPGGDGGTGNKPREVKLTLPGPGGDLNGYTEDEIKRAIKTREGIFRKCYQKELDRTPGLGGKLVVRFKIGPDGTVQSASKAAGSTMSHDGVEECVTNNVGKLKFAPKGVVANVTFPFVYSQGGS